MRRSAPFLLIGLFGLVGCQKPEDAVTMHRGSSVDLGAVDADYYGAEASPARVDAGNEPVVEYGLASVPRSDRGTSQPAMGGQTHVVGKGDTLFKLARRYYNDPSRWKDIYQANAGRISDPNMIRVGQELLIP